MRNVQPQTDGTADFLRGLYAGLADRPIPVVAIEASDSKPSAVPAFRRYKISTVDDVDTKVGRAALALLLADAPGGAYGIKPTATDGVLPEVVPVSSPGAGG